MSRSVKAQFVAGLCVVLLIASGGLAATINVGDNPILPAPGQEILITISGGDAAQGLEFIAQLGDNGNLATELTFESVEIVAAGFVFNPGNSNPQGDLWTTNQLYFTGTTTIDPQTATASGTLARLVIDASGASPGQVFSLLLADAGEDELGANFSTNLAGLPISITPGTITILPEPGTLTLLGIGLAGLAFVYRRRRS